MRTALTAAGIACPKWKEITTESDLVEFGETAGWPLIIKTARGGYDGKGVRVVSSIDQVSDWLENIEQFGGELLLEEKVDFVGELAQLSARTPSGQFKAWPLVETVQESGVCAEVIAPAQEVSLHPKALEIAQQISEGLGVVGVMAVELFRSRSGEILVNELAMRPHNSGHFSIDASITSQFEQHLRSVMNWPLGNPDLRCPAAMINLLGEDGFSGPAIIEGKEEALAEKGVYIHLYGKKLTKPFRKMGHVTILDESVEALKAKANRIKELIKIKSIS